MSGYVVLSPWFCSFVGCGFPNFSGVKSICESVVLQPARDPAINAATRLVCVFMVVVFLWLRVWSFHLLDVEHRPRTVIEGFRWTVKAKMGNSALTTCHYRPITLVDTRRQRRNIYSFESVAKAILSEPRCVSNFPSVQFDHGPEIHMSLPVRFHSRHLSLRVQYDWPVG